MSKFEKWSLFLQVAGIVLVTSSIFYASNQLSFSEEQEKRKVVKETMQFMSAFIVELEGDAKHLRDNPIQNNMSDEQFDALINIGNRLQYMCYQLHLGVFESEVVNYFFGQNLARIYFPTKDLIEKLQNNNKTTWPDIPKCYKNWKHSEQ